MPYFKLYYHYIWATKERLYLIEPAFEPELYRAIAAKAQKTEGFTHAFRRNQNHLHLAIFLPAKWAPACNVGIAKDAAECLPKGPPGLPRRAS